MTMRHTNDYISCDKEIHFQEGVVYLSTTITGGICSNDNNSLVSKYTKIVLSTNLSCITVQF